MSIKPNKLPLFLLLPILLLLSFAPSSLCYEVPYPKTDKEICEKRCHETKEDFSVFLDCANRCERIYGHEELERHDPRDPKDIRWQIERCKQLRCQGKEYDERELKKCHKRCEEEVIKRREVEDAEDPRMQYERCKELCERQEGSQRTECRRRCKREFEEKQREREERSRETKSRELEKQNDNPYYFHAQRLQSRHKTQEGHINVLEKFSDRSELLRGIENYRLSTLEANPNTLVVPHHCDAESIVLVLRGKGTITWVLRKERQSYNLEQGDVMRIPAGATVYLINHDNKEKLNLVKLMQPVNSPGNFREFFAAGGENPESVYRVFSNDVLEAALNTPRDQLERLLGQQRQGAILKVPREQLKALSQQVSSTKQIGEGPFNLLKQPPLYSNRYGNFIEASPNDFKQLQDMDVSVSSAEINRGALMVPHYNSEAIMILLVLEGTGRVEMACPHVASERRQQRGRGQETEESRQYEKISSNLSPGDFFVIPAGHPAAIIASQNQNLLTIWFGINARNNQRNFLAGGDNIMNQIERKVKEISFNSPAEMVEQIFRNQKESHFVAGPQQREEEREYSIPSILDFTGFF